MPGRSTASWISAFTGSKARQLCPSPSSVEQQNARDPPPRDPEGGGGGGCKERESEGSVLGGRGERKEGGDLGLGEMRDGFRARGEGGWGMGGGHKDAGAVMAGLVVGGVGWGGWRCARKQDGCATCTLSPNS